MIEIVEGDTENSRAVLMKMGLPHEMLYESFVAPGSEGFSLDFIQKNRGSDNFRKNFLSKLTYQKIWLSPSQQLRMHETAIIFDWDDTILCTSFINPAGVYRPTELPI
jgi:hypothetical protein